jgi:hypothetical protein
MSEITRTTVKEHILQLFKDAATSKAEGKAITIGQLTQNGKILLENISTLKFKINVDFVLNPSYLRHVFTNHYGNNEKDKGQNNPLTDEDIQNIADVLIQPDKVLFLGYDRNTQANTFAFLKTNPKGTYTLIEVYGNCKGNLTARSFYNTKTGIDRRATLLIHTTTLLTTSKTTEESPSSQSKVPQLIEWLPTQNESNTSGDKDNPNILNTQENIGCRQ